MSDPATDVIVATGGTAVVRAAHRSGNPALGVGPGNVPVLVDATADLAGGRPAHRRQQGLRQLGAVHQRVRPDRRGAVGRQAAARAAPAAGGPARRRGRDRLRAYLFPDGRLNGEAIGRDAAWIAAQAGLRVPPRTRVLLAPIDLVVSEEPLAHEKLCPVLALVRCRDSRARHRGRPRGGAARRGRALGGNPQHRPAT